MLTVSPADVLPVGVLESEALLEPVLEEVSSVAARSLRADGITVLPALAALYAGMAKLLSDWRNRPVAPPSSLAAESVDTPAAPGAMAALGVGAGFGGAVGAVAYFAAAATAALAALSGVAFGIFAAIATFVMVRKPDDSVVSDPQRVVAANDAHKAYVARALDALEGAVQTQRERIAALQTTLVGVSEARAVDDDARELPHDRVFRTQLVTAEIVEAIHGSQVSEAEALDEANRWLQSLGTWDELLRRDVAIDATELDTYCAARVERHDVSLLLSDPACAELTRTRIAEFVGTWKHGIACSLEGESQKQFDPDGFDEPLRNVVFASPVLRAEAIKNAAAAESVLTLHDDDHDLHDLFILTAMTDVHPDAVAPLRVANQT